ncbi:hypothetical protein HMPREF0183_1621 [Brevibacterium mcbrellneri ATCC 49030]|uniref:Uncharacterized protein n=1 Tax=Brevibacterium mcbrellneri ATCC 49030 TaxID=585530 RepID=D4YNW1_9MICO|nr:hypothetical protein [Brevibacterium mcbrellneri]EFG47101.1 hypothetical protein HMPREF0183_1621 [Brevibacterium mcbrellneri ATCC 49030]
MKSSDSDGSVPEWERLSEDERVRDEDWDAIVADFGRSTAYNSEVSAEEVTEYLEQREDWEGPVVDKVDLRDAQPARVVSLVALVGGILAIIVVALFVRPVPLWGTVMCVAVAAGGGVGAIFTLPKDRRADDDGGAQV